MSSTESFDLSLETSEEVLDAPVPLAHHLHKAGLLEELGGVRLVTDEAPPVREHMPPYPTHAPMKLVRRGPPPVRSEAVTREVERAAPIHVTPTPLPDRAVVPPEYGTLEPALERRVLPPAQQPMTPAILVAGGMLAGLFATFRTLLLTRF